MGVTISNEFFEGHEFFEEVESERTWENYPKISNFDNYELTYPRLITLVRHNKREENHDQACGKVLRSKEKHLKSNQEYMINYV